MLTLRDRILLCGAAGAPQLWEMPPDEASLSAARAWLRSAGVAFRDELLSARHLALVEKRWRSVAAPGVTPRIEWVELPVSPVHGGGTRRFALQSLGPVPEPGVLPWIRASRDVNMRDHLELDALFRSWGPGIPARWLAGEKRGAVCSVAGALCEEGCGLVWVALRSLPDAFSSAERNWLRKVLDKGGTVLSVAPNSSREHPRQHRWRRELLGALAGPWLVLSLTLGGGLWKEALRAVECGTQVLALPVRPRPGGSEGVPALLRMGAQVLDGPETLCASLPGLSACGVQEGGRAAREREPGQAEVGAEAGRLLDALRVEEALELAGERIGVSAAQARTLAMELEIAGLIVSVGGGRYRAA